MGLLKLDAPSRPVHRIHGFRLLLGVLLAFIVTHPPGAATASAADPLPSWNNGVTKTTLLQFVTRVTTPGSPDFVPPPARIATFDNDGTLWGEQPVYYQLLFVFDRVNTLSTQHPEWKEQEPYASILRKDFKAALAGGEKAILELVMATHAGMTPEEFHELARAWMATARHPMTGRRLTEMTYQPMLELLDHLRASGFKTYIVSGGGVEFLRAWSEETYGIPPEQVIGSSIRLKFEQRQGKATLVRLPELNFIDDKAGKPIAIQEFIGRRPILAFGNSDGDLEMLQWSAASPGHRLCLLVHHDDAVREFAYDRDSSIGRLDRAMDEARSKGWTLVSMRSDWNTIYCTKSDKSER